MRKYDYILDVGEMALLEGLVQLLDVFNVFTTYVQGDKYPTMNTMALFYTEIEDRLKEINLFNTNALIENAANILLKRLPERFELQNEHIAAALIDPQIQHLPIVDRWIRERGTEYFIIDYLHCACFSCLVLVSGNLNVFFRHEQTRSHRKDGSKSSYKHRQR